ncbi:LysM peptidoglycan-binding domain-containing protein [Ferruginibacter lapsinanis]|uniref:LysM peptidoglycan-binding domain-containing protein n=1 Tax=Ferruginibacter lapsinanis TaxID=563172 RepID=UPI001E4B3639|nr:LysM peptidoglycan-binding domain-containing protein [Ferruginibacter lapsinanis]UEG51241.1 LysM peptidoglycan-binding domain-containing protein [Ferruginibacter lapsinanis]
MKRLFIILFCLPLFALAQKEITHTVGPKESLTSIGRLYNINGRELAKYNNIDYEKGLSLGQVLKIPASATTTKPVVAPPVVKKEPVVTKPVVKNNEVAGTPIYHTVAKKETLYGISTMYGKVPIADIKKWNNLTADGLNEGMQLIVGYTTKTTTPVVKNVVKEAPPAVKEEVKVVKEVKRPDPVVKEDNTPPPAANTGKNLNGGFFKSLYMTQTRNANVSTESGVAGVFKSTSGWEDGKYYCLHNDANAGTIVKISNPATGKSIYAKVLDVIPDIKQNTGLLLRISNAAAEELGVSDAKFDCSVSYVK